MNEFPIPEGFILMIILFGIPYLLSRKNDITLVRNVIHSYMLSTELFIWHYYAYVINFKYKQKFINTRRYR